jgi:ribosomal protein S18 acetylase RimI-like enzyme
MAFTIRSFKPADQAATIQLWRDCQLVVPWNDPAADIARKLEVQGELFLLGEVDGTIVASVMGGYEGHRGWINYLAVAPSCQRRGYGRLLMLDLEQRLKQLGCPKINLQVRTSNSAIIGFYQALGYQIDEVVSLGKRLN